MARFSNPEIVVWVTQADCCMTSICTRHPFLKSLKPTPATSDLGECQKVTRMDICSADIGHPWLRALSDIGTHVWLKKCNISTLPPAWIRKDRKRVPQSHQGTKHTSRHQEHWESLSFHLQSPIKIAKAKVVQKMMGHSWHPFSTLKHNMFPDR